MIQDKIECIGCQYYNPKECFCDAIGGCVKYEDTHGGMTNRQYLATLSNEELSNVIYDVIVDRVGRRYNSSRLGVAQWLGELYRESDFIKGSAYYTDNKRQWTVK